MKTEKAYWFPAKRYGWGWGLPSVWQGWVVMAVFVGALAIGAATFLSKEEPGAFAAYSGFLCLLLIAVCGVKGEPPRWRWGEK